MGQAFTPGLIATENTRIEKLRELPVPGEILVKIGDRVKAEDVIARAFLPGELHILRIAEKLGIEPFEVMKGLKVKLDEAVRENQLLCEHSGLFGLFRSRFHSSVSGTVELITERTGHVAIRSAPKPIELRAYIGGEVAAVEIGKSASIKANGAFVQGIFGVGGERYGVLKVLNTTGSELRAADLPSDCHGAILVTAIHPNLEALRTAAERGAVGLISGAIDDKVLAGYLGFDLGIALTGDEDVSMSVIITEGFGSLPMSTRTLGLLTGLDGRVASINGATQVRAGAVRPEIIVPATGNLIAKSAPACAPAGLVVGAAIRLIRVPYFGQYAVVTELPHAMEEIPTGAHARVLRAKLKDGSLVTVPRANVELVS